ncbi:MAG: radical SAM protein [Candidatus Omnitrophota bacterium]
MRNKILLIRPKNVYNYNNYPTLGLISLASVLKTAGYQVKIINCAFEKDPLQAIAKELPEVLFAGISLLTSESPDAYRIMSFIKEKSDLLIAAGGWHCTLFPEQMVECRYVDYVIAGEGEEHILALAEQLKNGRKPATKIFKKKTLNMELLPSLDYEIDTDIERFITSYLTDKFSENVKQPMRWLPYESSRGCPSLCTFCINVVTDNNHYRIKSAEKVISEVDSIVKKHRLTHLKIIDDNFFVDMKRVIAICEGFIKKKLNITWDGECRCDYFKDSMINDQALKLLKASGLVQLTLGIESGSARTLKLMKKGIVPEQAEAAVKKCNEYRIVARSSFIIEIPGEQIEDIKKTIAFINRLRKYPYYTCGINTFRPYPKCELTGELLKQGYLKEPGSFVEWTDKSVIDLYTAAEYKRPWQVAAGFSESAAYYLSMESSVRLGKHQLSARIDRCINALFVRLARIRNKFMFYHFPFEKHLYRFFLTNYYKKNSKDI